MKRLSPEKEAQLTTIGYHWHPGYENYFDKDDNTLELNLDGEWETVKLNDEGEEEYNHHKTFDELIDWYTPR